MDLIIAKICEGTHEMPQSRGPGFLSRRKKRNYTETKETQHMKPQMHEERKNNNRNKKQF